MNVMNILKGLVVLLFPLAMACSNSENPGAKTVTGDSSASTPVMNFDVVNIYPHDTIAYTEGFLVHDGQLFESTGHTDGYASSRSLFGPVDLKTGKIDTKVEIDPKKYFGEGIVFLNGKVYQLTLDTRVGFVYDARTYKKIKEFNFPSAEGWGLTTDGKYLVMSDGTSNISYLDPESFKLVKILGVTNNYGPVGNLNELEFIDGFLYANIYLSNKIIRIDPQSGKVVGEADLSSLSAEAKNKYPGSEYMNGIAYDSVARKIYITGKLWPNIYEIKFR
jgi:glutamine cyclotransferase